MANFTVEILTWSNVERGKGKPTRHLFSTHISAIFVRTPYPHDKNDCSQLLMSCKQPAEAPKRAPDH